MPNAARRLRAPAKQPRTIARAVKPAPVTPAPERTESEVVALQRLVGNRAVQRAISSGVPRGGNRAVATPAAPGLVQRGILDSLAQVFGFTPKQGPELLVSVIGNKKRMTEIAKVMTAPDMMANLKGAGVAFRKRFSLAVTYWSPLTLADLQTDIDGASQADRDTVWKRKSLMKKAKKKLPVQDYLSLLPALRMYKKGKTAEDGKSHTKADQADKYIRTHLAGYVGEAVKAGKQVEGQVAVLDGADWDLAYDKEFGDDGEQDTTNAFVDQQGRIWLHRTRGNAGTMIHEGIHKYSVDAVINMSQPFNEGVTEYFTRKICSGLTPPVSRGNYQSNWEVSDRFAGIVGEAVLAKAYFDGDTAGMKTAFTGSGRTEAQWTTFFAETKANKWAEADAALDKVPEPEASPPPSPGG